VGRETLRAVAEGWAERVRHWNGGGSGGGPPGGKEGTYFKDGPFPLARSVGVREDEVVELARLSRNQSPTRVRGRRVEDGSGIPRNASLYLAGKWEVDRSLRAIRPSGPGMVRDVRVWGPGSWKQWFANS